MKTIFKILHGEIKFSFISALESLINLLSSFLIINSFELMHQILCCSEFELNKNIFKIWVATIFEKGICQLWNSKISSLFKFNTKLALLNNVSICFHYKMS